MRSTLLFSISILLAGCGADFPQIKPVEPKPITLTLGTENEQVGMKTRRTSQYHVELDLTADVGDRSAHKHLVGDGKASRTEEVLEVASGHITKLRVSYDDETLHVEGDDTPRTDPTVGKTYIIVPVPNAPANITHEDGSAPSAKESKRVGSDYKWLDKTLPTQTKTFTVDEQVAADIMPFLEEEAAKVGVNVTTASAVYRGVHEGEGVFDVDLKLSKSDSVGGGGGAEVELALRGQVGRRADGHAGEYTGAGTINVSAEKGSVTLKCTGTFNGTGAWHPL